MTRAIAAEGDMRISNLRDVPGFASTVADRLWNAWWKDEGVALSALEERLAESLGATPIPFTLVAHDGETFLGTVSLIESDMEERPQYTPWLAALWVDDAFRKTGIGSALIDAATRNASGLRVPVLYLCTEEGNAAFYQRRGWQVVENGVNGLTIFSRRSD